jgi:arylformamidase
MTVARLRFDAAPAPEFLLDFGAATSLALPLTFDGAQPRHFGAPAARSMPYVAGGFNGEVARGASCNCRRLELVPHCNGTHTEGAGHLTLEADLLHEIIPAAPLPALLLSVVPEAAGETREDTDPAPHPGDRLLTASAIAAAWPRDLPFAPRALLLRTPNDPQKPFRDYTTLNPAYLSRQAVGLIVARGIEHLVLDLPSLDRSDDGGRLTGHRLFFGLPPASTRLADATRRHCTLTEFAWFPDALRDGPCALLLQVPAFSGDAVPSRPLHLPVVAA